MMSEAVVEPDAPTPAGETRFIRPSEAKSLIAQAEQDGYVNVDVPELRPALRGRLSWLLEEAIERTLELRGACGPGIGAAASLDLSLTDQLYRARLLGARGLVLVMPTLEGITNRSGTLDADDSSTLRWWIGCARQRPLRLYLDVADCMLGAYLDPVTLTQMMNTAPPVPMTSVASPPVVVEWVDSAATPAQDVNESAWLTAPEGLDASPISDVVASVRGADLGEPTAAATLEPAAVLAEASEVNAVDAAACDTNTGVVATPVFDAEDAAGEAQDVASDDEAAAAGDDDEEALRTETALEPLALEPSLAPPPYSEAPQATIAYALASADELEGFESKRGASVLLTGHSGPELDVNLTPLAAPTEEDLVRASSVANEIPTQMLPIPHPATIPAPAIPALEELPRIIDEPSHLPLHVDAPNAWRSWMQRLDAARGPKPLNAIEQLFINAYVPLQDAFQRGIAGPECRPILDHWASSFAKSYTEAFDALRLRGRRPMMVLDIPEAAQRLARLHGARSVQLVLVDGMRFDLGLRVESRLVAQLGQQATLTDRFLLWSALPSTTAQQLELISRGPEGLRDGDIHSETPVLVARGRSAATLRRVRAGSRELLKLDLVEARLGELGGPLSERLDQLGVEVGDALATALSRLPPRTLVTVFGDHGFCLDAQDAGTSAMRQGGASPEEVLVPGFAWLVGQTH